MQQPPWQEPLSGDNLCRRWQSWQVVVGSPEDPLSLGAHRHPAATSRGARFSLSQQADRPVCPGPAAPGLAETRALFDLLLKKGRGRLPASCPGGRPSEFLRKPLSKAPKPPQNEAPLLPLPCGLPSCQCLQATWPSPCQALTTSILPTPLPPPTFQLHLFPDLPEALASVARVLQRKWNCSGDYSGALGSEKSPTPLLLMLPR